MNAPVAAMAAGAGAAATREAAAQERATVEESERQGGRTGLAKSMLKHYKGEIPSVPTTVEEALERKDILNQSEVMFADPWNRIVVRVIQHIAEKKQEDYENSRGFAKLKKALSEPYDHARIKEIMRFFAGVDRDHVLDRLKILEQSGLITYQDVIGDDIYSPTVWTYEQKKNKGFRLSDEVKAVLLKEEGGAE